MPSPNFVQPYELVCAELNQLRRRLAELVTEWERRAADTCDNTLAGCADELQWSLNLTTTFPQDPGHPDYRWHQPLRDLPWPAELKEQRHDRR